MYYFMTSQSILTDESAYREGSGKVNPEFFTYMCKYSNIMSKACLPFRINYTYVNAALCSVDWVNILVEGKECWTV